MLDLHIFIFSIADAKSQTKNHQVKKRRRGEKISPVGTALQNMYRAGIQKGKELARKSTKSLTANPPRTHPTPAGSSHQGQTLGKWTPEDMQAAWQAHQGGLSISASARAFNIPISTCKDRFRKLKQMVAAGQDISQLFGHCSGGRNLGRIFTVGEEKLLSEHLRAVGDGGFGYTQQEVRALAYSWGELNDIPVNESEKEMMSSKWFKCFVERHPELKLANAKEISIYRAMAPTEQRIQDFFTAFENLITEYKITEPQFIWNIDETGLQDQPKGQKIVISTGQPQLQVVPGERGQLSTVLCYANAAGTTGKPTIIFKGVDVQEAWKEYLPQGWNLFASHNGWITKQIFMATGRKFLKFLEEQGLYGQHHIVLMDGHSTHSYNYPLAVLFAAHKVHVLLFPPHCTHFLQPFDAVILSQLKRRWQLEMTRYNRQMCGKKMNKAQFFIPFRRAWHYATQPNYIQASFRKTGMWPLDRERVDSAWYKCRVAMGER